MDEVKGSADSARSYRQFCALARSLDIVGERWTLLIVRELLGGPMRYSELKTSLAGIATNLLADRLRGLEAHGVVERRLHAGGVAYALTDWGLGLREPMEALGRWGQPLLATGQGEDAFQPRWLVLALPALLRGRTSSPPVELGIQTDGFSMVLRIDEAGPSVTTGEGPTPDAVLVASPEVVVGLAAGGGAGVEEAAATAGFSGDPRVLRSVFGADPANRDAG